MPYHIKQWLKEVKIICPKCESVMKYMGKNPEYLGDTFQCKCGFRIYVNEDFTWATVELQEASCT